MWDRCAILKAIMKFLPRARSQRTIRSFLQTFLFTLCAAFLAVSSILVLVGNTLVTYESVRSKITGTPPPFPIGVDPSARLITENPNAEKYLDQEEVSPSLASIRHPSWIQNVFAALTRSTTFQNIASPAGRILVIQPGERKEEIAQNFGKLLDWDKEERALFMDIVASSTPSMPEGTFAPGSYITTREATPPEVAGLVNAQFLHDIESRYTDDIEEIVPLEQALTIASLLEREAYDFEDMRHISGIIWNRLFVGMNLQIDATLQYAKGSKPQEPWWPRVLPSDKYIASAYNTYANKGLPPAPIANPSLDAIVAALNPRNTECMFYFHDSTGGFHCAKTYKEHVALLKEHYGRGK